MFSFESSQVPFKSHNVKPLLSSKLRHKSYRFQTRIKTFLQREKERLRERRTKTKKEKPVDIFKSPNDSWNPVSFVVVVLM